MNRVATSVTAARGAAKGARAGQVAWALFDWAVSPFSVLIITFVFPAYFAAAIAGDQLHGQALWGYAVGASGLVVALLSAPLGAIADAGGRRKPWILGFMLLGDASHRAALVRLSWPRLPVTGADLGGHRQCGRGVQHHVQQRDAARYRERRRVGRLSGWAWGLGYAGGLAALAVAFVAFVQPPLPLFDLDRDSAEHIRIVGPLVACWMGLFGWPLLLLTPDRPARNRPMAGALRDGLANLSRTLRDLRARPGLLRFLLANMLYADGLVTLFALGGVYVSGAFGMSLAEVVVFGLTLNVAAGVGAFAFGWLDDRLGSRRIILLALAGLIIAGAAAASVQTRPWLWLTGGFLGIFVGPVQASSSSADGASGARRPAGRVLRAAGSLEQGDILRRARLSRRSLPMPPAASGSGWRLSLFSWSPASASWRRAAETTMADPVDQALVRIARDLAHELWPGRRAVDRAGLDSSLDRDWGFDSLSRAELLLRVERAFGTHLPERLLGEAETLRDLVKALAEAKPAWLSRAELGARAPAPEAAEPAPPTARTITEVLDWHARRHSDRVHIVLLEGDGKETPITYRQLRERARAVARGLVARGLEPGQRVAIMLPTSEAFFVAFFGVLYAGGVPTPIYPPARLSRVEEHLRRQANILRNARAVMLIAAPEASAIGRLLGLQLEACSASTRSMTLPWPALKRCLCRLARATEMALVQYTSGSTGDPKGVVLSHANLLANIRAMGEAMAAGPSDVFVSWLPLYHDMGLIGAWLGSLYFAAPLVVMSPLVFLVRPESWLWAIHRHKGTLSAAPNFAFELCLRRIDEPMIAGLDLGSLRMVTNGSEAVSPATIRRFAERFGPYGFRRSAMAPVYGLAENAVGLAFPPLDRMPIIDRVDRRALTEHGKAAPATPEAMDALEFVACGRPLPGHQIRIVDATGEVGERQEGRLQFRGPSATSGYLDNPARTSELFDGPWLNSGDLAYVAGGDVFITGRSKDIIIRAGRHIYPEELEAAIGDLGGVRKGCVAVFGTADPRTGTERLVVVAETRLTEAGRTHRPATSRRRDRDATARCAARGNSARAARQRAQDLERQAAACGNARSLRKASPGQGERPCIAAARSAGALGSRDAPASGMARAFRSGLRGVVVGRARHCISGAVAAGCSGARTEAALGHRARHCTPAAALDGRTCGRDRGMAESWRDTACHQP